MFAIRASRDYVTNDDFMRAVRKVGESKKLETTLDVCEWLFMIVLCSTFALTLLIQNSSL